MGAFGWTVVGVVVVGGGWLVYRAVQKRENHYVQDPAKIRASVADFRKTHTEDELAQAIYHAAGGKGVYVPPPGGSFSSGRTQV